MQDDLLSQFISITGADNTVAQFHLDAAGNRLEQAIEMFFAGTLQDQQVGDQTHVGRNSEMDDEELARKLSR